MAAFDLETAARALMPKEILATASSAHLALHVSDAFVLVAVSDVASEKPVWSQYFMLEDQWGLSSAFDFVASKNWLEKVFRKVTLSFDDQIFTLVPEPFFDPSKVEEVLRFNHPNFQGITQQLELREADSRLLFRWPAAVDPILRIAPHMRVMPLAFLMARFAHHPQWNDSEQINVLVSDSQMVITATRQLRLLFLNSFEVSNETDVLYHLSNLAIRLAFDLERVPVLVLRGGNGVSLDLLQTYCGALRKAPFDAHVHPIIHLHSICA